MEIKINFISLSNIIKNICISNNNSSIVLTESEFIQLNNKIVKAKQSRLPPPRLYGNKTIFWNGKEFIDLK